MLYAELLEKTWKEKMDDWGKRPKGEHFSSLGLLVGLELELKLNLELDLELPKTNSF